MATRTVDTYRQERQRSVDYTCQLFGISRQSYYKRKRSYQHKQSQAIDIVMRVRDIRRTIPRVGTRKLHYMLCDDCSVGRDRLFGILQSNHLLVKPQKSYHITANSKHMFHKHPNLLVDLPIVRPEQVWVSDITYIDKRGYNHYLALVTDAYSKKIVGYDLSDSLSTQGAVRALKMALKYRQLPDILIHHSDCGIQYCCDAYQSVLGKEVVMVSMTQNGDPLENAIAERVNGILKDDFELERYCGTDSRTLRRIVAQSIVIYNNRRPHFSCALLTPAQMHEQNELPRAMYHKKIRSRLVSAPNKITKFV